MLGCDLISCINGILHRICNKNITIVVQTFLDDLFAGKLLSKFLCLSGNFFCQFFTCRDQDRGSQLIMLCLR